MQNGIMEFCKTSSTIYIVMYAVFSFRGPTWGGGVCVRIKHKIKIDLSQKEWIQVLKFEQVELPSKLGKGQLHA